MLRGNGPGVHWIRHPRYVPLSHRPQGMLVAEVAVGDAEARIFRRDVTESEDVERAMAEFRDEIQAWIER